MQARITRFVALFALLTLLMPSTALGVVARDGASGSGQRTRGDKLSHPLGDRQADLKQRALESALKGKVEGGVVEVSTGEFVQLDLEGEGMVWTVPGEFADYPHNSIPEPDRTVDNSTIWVEDFSEAYYDDLLYAQGDGVNSMAEFFREQSSGRYTVTGDVTEWVPVPGDAVTYDDGDPGPGTATNVWQFLTDSLDGWYDMQLAKGMTPEEIDAYLADFDVWDRYDYDDDGIFDEPDGYIDHFQSLHSGEGNEAGGGELGDDSIWSHSWYAYYTLIGEAGPDGNPLGGIQVGDSDYWIGDYTIQPENGGVGVFTHEFTHDLGLPDLYDTSGAGENATGFWTLMSSGSWLSDNTYDIGSAPGHLGAWEKLQLGWLDYTIATPGQTAEIALGPAEYNNTEAQAVIVNLPDKLVEQDIGDPYSGDWFFYSGAGDDIDHYMYKEVTLPAGSELTAQVFYEIESNWDYAYVVVSTNGGLTWTSVETNVSTTTDPNGQNFGFGITGSTNRWTKLTADLSAYEGDVLVGFRYWTDGAVTEPGFMADDVAITGLAVDGAEADTGWTFDGFKRTTGFEQGYYNNYYIGEYRQYWGYDSALGMGCYNFGFLKGRYAAANLVERFAYGDGLLLWYCDDSRPDNNTSAHPGSGFALPVDSHPTPLVRNGKTVWRNRIQTYDAVFGLDATDALLLHDNSRAYSIPSLAAAPVFDDALSYWSADNPTGSVIIPTFGTRVEVLGTATAPDGGSYMNVSVTAPAE